MQRSKSVLETDFEAMSDANQVEKSRLGHEEILAAEEAAKQGKQASKKAKKTSAAR